MLELLNRVKLKEVEEKGFFPNIGSIKRIVTNEDRRVQHFIEKESNDLLIHERFPLSNAIDRSTLENEEQVLQFFYRIIDSGVAPIEELVVSQVFEIQFVSLLYRIPNDSQLLADAPKEISERENFEILRRIEIKLLPFTLHRSQEQINLPHVHPYSLVRQPDSSEFDVITIGSLFDQNVYYLSSVDGSDIYSESFSGSSVYFTLGFLSFELLTGENPCTAWRNAEIRRELKNDDRKFLSDDVALEYASYYYKYWWLKTLCNLVPEFRKVYNPSKESDLLIEKMHKRYKKTLKAVNEINEKSKYIVSDRDKAVIDYLAYLDVSTRDLEDEWWKYKNKDIIPTFLISFTDFLTQCSISWQKGYSNIQCDEYNVNYATSDYLQIADEFENFLSQAHGVFSSRLHDSFYYPTLLYYQAVKNEVYCLLIALLDHAGMRNPDETRDQTALELLQNTDQKNIDVEFEESISSILQKAFNSKDVLIAFYNLFNLGNDAFERFHAIDLNTVVGLLIFLSGNAKFILHIHEDKSLDILKKTIPIEDGALRSIIGNLSAFDKKINKINKRPTEVDKDDFNQIIELTELIFHITGKLNPADIKIGYQQGVSNPKDKEIRVTIDDEAELDVPIGNIAYPSGRYETLYSSKVGVAMIDDRICYINPPSHQISIILDKIRRSAKTQKTGLAVVSLSSECELRNLLENENYFGLNIRKRIRKYMGKDKEVFQIQKVDQIINIAGQKHTVNTGTVNQVIQQSTDDQQVYDKSNEIQPAPNNETKCSHKAIFELNDKRCALTIEGQKVKPTVGDVDRKIYKLLKALAPNSRCGSPNEDCEFSDLMAQMEYQDNEEAEKRVRQNITKIRTHKNRKIRKLLTEMELGITPEELFITPESKQGSGGYRLHEDFCIMDLTEEKVPDEE